MICYLLFGTSIIIKGVLPLSSTQFANEEVETPLLETGVSIMEAGSSSQAMETIEENNAQQSSASHKETNTSNDSRQPTDDVEMAKQMAIEAWKVLFHICYD